MSNKPVPIELMPAKRIKAQIQDLKQQREQRKQQGMLPSWAEQWYEDAIAKLEAELHQLS